MSGSVRSAPLRGVLVLGAGLLLFSTFVAIPAFTHGQAADIPFGSDAFAAQWSSIEPVIPNFWGPAVQPALREPYVEATGGTRAVQYFDKARMEQTTAGGAVTNGLLTVELISGQRQMGDNAFAAFAPSLLPVVGDPANPWPPYRALGGTAFPTRVNRSGEPVGMVYKPDGAFGLNPGLAAQPGAAFGDYQSDPGGKYGHNIPLAFSSYLAALPLPWQTAMGFPLTEAFWVNVALNNALTWVLVQPFERRVLSYTPTNPPRFQVEMGNIGQHYSQWRYVTGATAPDDPTASATAAGTGSPATSTAPAVSGTTASGTQGPLAISSVQLGAVTDSTFALTFKTSAAATTEILYGTSSHSYPFHQDISTTATRDHAVSLPGLQPGTKYYFALRATAGGVSIQRREDFFTTAGVASSANIANTATSFAPTKIPSTATAIPTTTPKPPSATATTIVQTIDTAIARMTVGASNIVQIAPATLLAENATVALSLSYDGASGNATGALHVTNWVRDPITATATGTGAGAPVQMTDKHLPLVLTATATIPFTDTTTPPIVVTYTRKVTPAEYSAGVTVISTPLSNARSPGYNVTLTFTLSLV